MLSALQRIHNALARVFTTLLLCLCPLFAHAESLEPPDNKPSIALIAPSGKLTEEIHRLLKEQLTDHSIHQLSPEQASRDAIANDTRLISLGSKSFVKAQTIAADKPLLAAYLSPQKNYPQGSATQVTRFYTGVSFDSQIQLAKQLLPKAKTIGVLVSPKFKQQLLPLKAAAEKAGMAINIQEWDGKGSLAKALNHLLKTSDYLLAVEDPAIYNRNTIKTILLTSYRKNKVVIGPNASYVKAGSLASIICSPEEITMAIAKLVRNNETPNSHQLLCSSMKLNHHVAKSLSINVPKHFEKTWLPNHEVRQ